MAEDITEERIITLVENGHNLHVCGMAGTGKSTIISKLFTLLKAANKSTQIICPTGMSCEVYDTAQTIHAFAGLGTGSLPDSVLFSRLSVDEDYLKRWRDTDVIIIDEASMLSKRIFNLLNSLAQNARGKQLSFGGIQVVIVADWLQVQPIHNNFDTGEHCFLSDIWDEAIPHTEALTKIWRQEEPQLINALSQMRTGRVSPEVELFLKGLAREISNEQEAIHIFFTNMMVDLLNSEKLYELAGERIELVAEDTGNVTSLKCSGKHRLYLKIGAPVMIVYNINDRVHNGTAAKFLGMEDDRVKVEVDNVGVLKLSRRTWYNYDSQGRVVGSRCQFPLVLRWAITAHKSQGQTLDKLVVHCSQEFSPGQTYVALSRVKKVSGLRVIGFNKDKLLPYSERVSHFMNGLELSTEPILDLSCCKKTLTTKIIEQQSTDDSTEEMDLNVNTSNEHALLDQLFEDEQTSEDSSNDVSTQQIDLFEVLDEMEQWDCRWASPPDDFDFVGLLEECRPETDFKSKFSDEINSCIDYAKLAMDKFKCWVIYIWNQVYIKVQSHLLENTNTAIRLSRPQFTSFTGGIHEILTSQRLKERTAALFGLLLGQVLATHQSLSFSVVRSIYCTFLKQISHTIENREHNELQEFSVSELDTDAKAKIRHIGGWVVHKLLKNARLYIKTNMFSDNKEVRANVKLQANKCELIEEHMTCRYELLKTKSEHTESLNLTESRQHREHGLIHISDSAYLFFLHLEQERVKFLSHSLLVEHREQLIAEAQKVLSSHSILAEKWQVIFSKEHLFEFEKGIVQELFQEAIQRYVNVGACQFLKDFRQKLKIQKSMALRKRVEKRARVKQNKESKLSMEYIKNDASAGKRNSHDQLKALIAKFGDEVLASLYIRNEIDLLCRAYGVTVRKKHNKIQQAHLLVEKVKSASQMENPV